MRPSRLAALLALAPGLAGAADLSLPPWTVVNDMACYSFQEAKKLKVLEVECLSLDTRRLIDAKNIADLHAQVANLKAADKKVLDANQKLDAQLKQTQADRDDAVKAKNKAEAYSVTGGGKVYVVGGVLVGLVGGLVAGYLISR